MREKPSSVHIPDTPEAGGGDHRGADRLDPGVLEGPLRLTKRRSGGDDVVDHDDRPVAGAGRADREPAAEVRGALRRTEPGLVAGPADDPEHGAYAGMDAVAAQPGGRDPRDPQQRIVPAGPHHRR